MQNPPREEDSGGRLWELNWSKDSGELKALKYQTVSRSGEQFDLSCDQYYTTFGLNSRNSVTILLHESRSPIKYFYCVQYPYEYMATFNHASRPRRVEHGAGPVDSRAHRTRRIPADSQAVRLGSSLSLPGACSTFCRCGYQTPSGARLGSGPSSHGGTRDPTHRRINLFRNRQRCRASAGRRRVGKLQPPRAGIAIRSKKLGLAGGNERTRRSGW